MTKPITLEQIKNIVIDIKSDDEWVNDSQTQAEYKGVCDGLDMLVNHLEELEKESENNIDINQYIEYDEGKNMRIYFKRTQFLEDAEEYLQNDNSDYEIVGIDD